MNASHALGVLRGFPQALAAKSAESSQLLRQLT
jgi:hypothetical protein